MYSLSKVEVYNIRGVTILKYCKVNALYNKGWCRKTSIIHILANYEIKSKKKQRKALSIYTLTLLTEGKLQVKYWSDGMAHSYAHSHTYSLSSLQSTLHKLY